MKYIIEANTPFLGSVESILNDDGTVGYSGGLSVVEYEAERGFSVQVIDDDALDKLTEIHLDSLITEAQEITEDRFHEMLNILPPCRWQTYGGWNCFHVSERLTHNLVSWFAKSGNEHYEFTDQANMTESQIVLKMAKRSKAAHMH